MSCLCIVSFGLETDVPAVSVLGELLALLVLAGFALLGSEFAGVGCRRADKLALLVGGLELRGGDAEWVRGGVGADADMAGKGPWGLRALVAETEIRGSIIAAAACAACT